MCARCYKSVCVAYYVRVCVYARVCACVCVCTLLLSFTEYVTKKVIYSIAIATYLKAQSLTEREYAMPYLTLGMVQAVLIFSFQTLEL